MIELYIENKKIDLTDDLEINFTYESIDPDKLSNIKNSFSKTVNIPGTPNNNITFGHIFRYDKYIPIVTPSNIDSFYDPHKKVNWFINKNGAVINRGYCTLDNIVVKNEREITYQLTLYGGIGEFFYALSYNDDGSPKTLYDMYWNWNPKIRLESYEPALTPSEENENVLMRCSANNIAYSYHNLTPTYNTEGTTDIDKDVVFVPCYTGLYEDFDSKHMIVNTYVNSGYETPETISKLNTAFPNSLTDEEGETYTTLDKTFSSTGYYKYGLVTFSRDIDPWEAGDLRVNELPVAVRLSKLMNVISNSQNNGGYEVIWDDEIKNSYQWLYSWVLLGKLKQDREEFNAGVFYPNQTYNDQKTIINVNTTTPGGSNGKVTVQQATTYNLSTGLGLTKGNYAMKLNVFPKFYLTGYTLNYFLGNYDYFSGCFNIDVKYDLWTTPVLIHKIYDQYDNLIKAVADIFYFSKNPYEFYFGKNNLDIPDYLINNTLQSRISEKFLNPGEHINDFNYHNCKLNYTSDTVNNIVGGAGLQEATFKCENVEIRTDFTLADDAILRVEQSQGIMSTLVYRNGAIDYVQSVLLENAGNIQYQVRPPYGIEGIEVSPQGPYGILHYNGNKSFTIYNLSDSNLQQYNNTSASFELNEAAQNGIIIKRDSGFNIINLDKKTLFANSQSPMKYLSDYCKLMNYKFICDNTEKKIYIKTLKNYYINKIIDLEDRVDLNRDINIKNITTKCKEINIGLESPETYPIKLFNKISKDKFNTQRFDTGLKYTAEKTNLLNNLIYKNAIDWQQSSIYYNLNPQFPRAYNVDSISWTLFKVDELSTGINLKKKEFITTGTNLSQLSSFASKDFLPKLSSFDNNNKYVDLGSSLIFLNGFVKNYDYNKLKSETTTVNLNPDLIESNKIINIDGNVVTNQAFSIYKYIINNDEEIIENIYKFTGDYNVSGQTYNLWVVNYMDANGNRIGVEYTGLNQPTYTDVILTIPLGTRQIWCNFRNSDTTKGMKAEVPCEILTPEQILTSKRVLYATGNIENSTYQDVWVFNNISTSNNYLMSARWGSGYGQYTVNYFNANGQIIGYEYTQQNSATYVNVPLHIPSGTRTIKMNTMKSDTTHKQLAISNTLYSISPRVMLSNDMNEQYYFNQDRCYVYDFVYSDFFKTWGIHPSDYGDRANSVATSWTLPMFCKDLYNSYSSGSNYTIETRDDLVDNTYFDIDGNLVSDNDFEIFKYNIIQDVNYVYSGKFEPGWNGVAISYYDTNNELLDTQYIVSSSDSDFEEVPLSIPLNATQIWINVRKIYSSDTVLKYSSDYIGWTPSDYKLASWNLTDQDGLDTIYDLGNTEFIKDTNFGYTRDIIRIGAVENNEYSIESIPSDNENTSRIFIKNWIDYLKDLYQRNTRDVTAYVDLSEFGEANSILRGIYSWKSHLWIITKLENFKIAEATKDKFTKVTLHKLYKLGTWTD